MQRLLGIRLWGVALKAPVAAHKVLMVHFGRAGPPTNCGEESPHHYVGSRAQSVQLGGMEGAQLLRILHGLGIRRERQRETAAKSHQ